MRNEYMTLMIYCFLVCILLELVISWIIHKKTYYIRDTFSHMTMGIGQQVLNLFTIGFLMSVYLYVYTSLSFNLFTNWTVFSWAILILSIDLCFYIAHRASHRVNIFYAAHIVHHQALDFNHGSALRQSWTARIFMFLFYLPLAVLGVPLDKFIMAQLGIMFIQFFSHNGLITRKLGILEYILVTPFNHRLHHSIRGEHRDSNYGGMLIIWDFLFGTYADKNPEKAVLGTMVQIDHYNPIKANFDYFHRIYLGMKNRSGWFSKIALLFSSPEVLQREIRKISTEKFRLNSVHHQRMSKKYTGWCILFFIVSNGTMFYMLKNAANIALGQKLLLSIVVILFLCLIGFMLRSVSSQGKIDSKKTKYQPSLQGVESSLD